MKECRIAKKEVTINVTPKKKRDSHISLSTIPNLIQDPENHQDYFYINDFLQMHRLSPKMQKKEQKVRFAESGSEDSKKHFVSSSSKKNPYSKFVEDSQSRNLMHESQKEGIEDQVKHENAAAAQIKLQEIDIVNASEQFKDQYLRLIENLEQNISPIYNNLYFFADENQDQSKLTKFLTFKLNKKNGRHIRFNEETNTCIPIFKCEGCGKEFSISSALGGHLSKCDYKDEHIERLEKIQMEMERQKRSHKKIWERQKKFILKEEERMESYSLSKSKEIIKGFRQQEKVCLGIDSKSGIRAKCRILEQSPRGLKQDIGMSLRSSARKAAAEYEKNLLERKRQLPFKKHLIKKKNPK